MRKKNILALLAIALILSTSATITAYIFIKDTNIKKLPYDVTFGNSIGFNIDPDAIHFGKLIPGKTSATRKINISNSKRYGVEFNLEPKGDYSEHISIHPKRFLLEKDSYREVNISLAAPEDGKEGNYSGHVLVLMKRS